MERFVSASARAVDWCDWLRALDEALEADPEAGESTAIIATIQDDRIAGASVGQAWLATHESLRILTHRQHRKPLLGSGAAFPVAFEAEFPEGTLLLATDGLVNYTSEERIRKALEERNIEAAVVQLIDAVRLPSGDLWDDVAVVLCRPGESVPAYG